MAKKITDQQLADLSGTGLGYHFSDLKKYNNPIGRHYDQTPLPVGITVDGDYIIDNTVPNTVDANGHMLDGLEHNSMQGKLPMHPTFSDQSPYRDDTAGKWEEAYGNGPGGVDVYYPTQAQMQGLGYIENLTDYYKHEKGRGIDDIKVPPPYKSIKGTPSAIQ